MTDPLIISEAIEATEAVTLPSEEQKPHDPLADILDQMKQLQAELKQLKSENEALQSDIKTAKEYSFQVEQHVLNSFKNEAVFVQAMQRDPKIKPLDGKFDGITRRDN